MSKRSQVNLKSLLKILAVSLFYIKSYAIDLGVSGKIFEINEVDIRVQMINELLNNVTNEDLKIEAEREAKKFYKNLPKFNLTSSRKTHTEHIDPTRVYEDAYWSFKKNNDGKYEWYKVSEAGSSVNWLEHHNGVIQKFFIFDMDSDIQVSIAKYLASLDDPFLTLVVIGGDIEKAASDITDKITYLNETIIREYDIQYVPVAISRGRGEFKDYYRKTRFDVDSISPSIIMEEIGK